jgi:hypothetical protein
VSKSQSSAHDCAVEAFFRYRCAHAASERSRAAPIDVRLLLSGVMVAMIRKCLGLISLAVVAALLSTRAPVIGQSTVLFRMDTSATAWPEAGFPWIVTDEFEVRWSRQLIPGAGPQGQNVVQLTELPGGPQHGWGWHGHIVPDLAQGGTRFYRWRHRVTAASNCSHTPSNKLLVIAQGCPGGRCRVIVQPKCNPQRMIQYNFQIDGGVYQVETGYVYPVGTWLNVQLETRTSSTESASDGALRLWVNNNNYSSPTIQNTGIQLSTGGSESSYIIFGGYNNASGVPAGATNIQQYTDFEIATAFDSSWSRGSSTPAAPAPPTSVRIVSGN